MAPIVCLDFDGVIHSYTSKWQGPRTIPDPPVPDAFCAILRYLAAGFDVVVHSSRSHAMGGRWAMARWMKRHAGPALWYDSPLGPGLERVRFVKYKPPALVTIDDRAITFQGVWSSEWLKPEAIRDFRPWNKR